MKKLVCVFMCVLFITVAIPVSALELSGNAWLLSQDKEQSEAEMDLMYQGELTLIGIGPVRIMGGLDYAGQSKDLTHVLKLFRGKIEDTDFKDHEGNLHMISGAVGKVRIDWPLFNGLTVIGSVGHRLAGNLQKTDGLTGAVVTSGVYGGTIFGGGLSLEIVRGLYLSSIYEIGPSLQGLHEQEDDAIWKSWDVGLEYRLPFISAKAGYREQNLENELNGFDLSGFYLGAGIHF